MTPPDDHCRAVDQQHPDDDWTLNERLLVLWDRAAVRWLVAAFVAAGFEHSVANMYFIPKGLLILWFAPADFWALLATALGDGERK